MQKNELTFKWRSDYEKKQQKKIQIYLSKYYRCHHNIDDDFRMWGGILQIQRPRIQRPQKQHPQIQRLLIQCLRSQRLWIRLQIHLMK